jgi:hypothetical protein
LETAQAKAERLIAEELARLAWQESDLALRRKQDPGKLQIAIRLRKETTLSVRQIAERLHFGTPTRAKGSVLTIDTAVGSSQPGSAAPRSGQSHAVRSGRQVAAESSPLRP